MIRHGDNTAVCFNDGKRSRAEVAYQREYWTESFVQWSPQGTMLATMHRQVRGCEPGRRGHAAGLLHERWRMGRVAVSCGRSCMNGGM